MSAKNFMSYGDAETILTEFANEIKEKMDDIYKWEEIPFTWTGHGFDSDLNDTDNTAVSSMSAIPVLKADDELMIDWGEHKDSRMAYSYCYWQSKSWLINSNTPNINRITIFRNIAGRIRFAVNNGANTSEIKMYKRKNPDWVPTNTKNRMTIIQKKAAFFGDSIMYGVISGQEERADPTIASLWIAGIAGGQQYGTNRAVSGASYTDLSGRSRIITQLINYMVSDAPSLLFVQGGINDWASDVPLDVFEDAVKETFDYIHRYNSSASYVFVISPFTVTDLWTGSGIKSELDSYRKILEKQAALYGFEYINGTDLLPMPKNRYYSDGLHLSQEGYTRVGMNLVNYITGIFIYDGELKIHNPGVCWTNKQDSDGRAVYRYTYNGSNSSNCGFSNTRLVDARGWASDSSNTIPLNWGDGNADHLFTVYMQSNGNIVVHKPTNYSTFEVTVEFVVL